MAGAAFQQAQAAPAKAPAPAAARPRTATERDADLARPIGNQARLRRLPALDAGGDASGTIRRSIASSTAAGATEVAGYINQFCPASAVASGKDVKAAPGSCTSNTGPGCECACTAMTDDKREYDIDPKPCNVAQAKETLHDGTSAIVRESTVWPNTGGKPCDTQTPITIPKAGSPMEFGAFDAKGKAFWYDTWRILAHELCGHGVNCETYSGDYGDREEHDKTIDTENKIAGAPARGHYADVPRQGESFANVKGDRSKVAFKIKDGWHYEAP